MFGQEFLSQAPALPVEIVNTPVGNVTIKAMEAGDKDTFDFAHAKAPSKDFRARLLVACAHNEDGTKAFTEANIPALSRLPLSYVEPLVEAAIRVNKLSDKDTEDLRKN